MRKVDLMVCWTCLAAPKSPVCAAIISVSGAVRCSEECSSDIVVGFTSPRPPRWAGRARSSRSVSIIPLLPVSAGRRD